MIQDAMFMSTWSLLISFVMCLVTVFSCIRSIPMKM